MQAIPGEQQGVGWTACSECHEISSLTVVHEFGVGDGMLPCCDSMFKRIRVNQPALLMRRIYVSYFMTEAVASDYNGRKGMIVLEAVMHFGGREKSDPSRGETTANQ